MSVYEDILNLKHFEPSSNHPRMTLYKRSAQFAPFAALSGFSEQIDETKRITNKKKVLDEDKKNEINNNLAIILNNKKLLANIVYFSKDKYKSGGKYINIITRVKKVDSIKKVVILSNNEQIKIDNIVELSVENIDIT